MRTTSPLTLQQSLAAYTSGSAQLVLGRSGRLRVGERADLAVAAADPFEMPAEDLASMTTAVAIVGGHVVFSRA